MPRGAAFLSLQVQKKKETEEEEKEKSGRMRSKRIMRKISLAQLSQVAFKRQTDSLGKAIADI